MLVSQLKHLIILPLQAGAGKAIIHLERVEELMQNALKVI